MSVEQKREGEAWEPLDTAVTIETPEHVRFRYMLAGPSRRLAAYLLDTLIRGAAMTIVVLLAVAGGFARWDSMNGVAQGVILLLLFLAEWGYFVLFETLWDGQSPGKRALRLRVVSASGRPLGFVDSVLRNLLRAADFLPMFYALGGAIVAMDPRFRRFGDFVGGTLVIAEDPREVEGLLSNLAAPTHTEILALPADAALLPQEIQALELYLRRRPRLAPERADELAELAARSIAGRLRIRYKVPKRLLEVLYLRAIGGPRGVA